MNSIQTKHKQSSITHTKKSKLLANQDIRRWYDNMKRGSPLTAEGYLRKLGRFCEMHQITPIHLAELAVSDLRAAADMLEDHVTMMEAKNYSSGYIEDHVNSVRSWFRHFDVEVKRRIKVTSSGFSPTIQNECIPNSREMTEINNKARLRESVMISLMAKSGLRPGVIGNHNGTDGLRMRDLPDIIMHSGTVECVRLPNRIIVRKELSKAGHQYFTFSTHSATEQIVSYLNDRLAHGESINEDSPVIHPTDYNDTRMWRRSQKSFLSTQRISDKIRQTFRPRFTWRPYILRAYFDTQLLIAESRGMMVRDFRVFFMGHKGNIESRYTTNKGILPTVLTNEMSDAFKRSEEYLEQTDVASSMISKSNQRQQIQEMINCATPQQIDCIFTMLKRARKTGFGEPAVQRRSGQLQ